MRREERVGKRISLGIKGLCPMRPWGSGGSSSLSFRVGWDHASVAKTGVGLISLNGCTRRIDVCGDELSWIVSLCTALGWKDRDRADGMICGVQANAEGLDGRSAHLV